METILTIITMIIVIGMLVVLANLLNKSNTISCPKCGEIMQWYVDYKDYTITHPITLYKCSECGYCLWIDPKDNLLNNKNNETI